MNKEIRDMKAFKVREARELQSEPASWALW